MRIISEPIFQGQTERTELVLNVPRHSRIRGVLEVGTVGAYWELRLGGDKQSAAAGSTEFLGKVVLIGRKALNSMGITSSGTAPYWPARPMVTFMSVTAYQNFGFDNNNHIAGFGWGAIYDTRTAQVRFSQDISKTFGYDISLVQPDYYVDNGTGQAGNRRGSQINSLGTFPLTALKLTDELWRGIPDAGRLAPIRQME